jgi:hypothetical protein
MKKDYFYVLGADDPEMRAIENILNENNLPFGYAMIENKRCHSGNAYLANNISGIVLPHALNKEFNLVYIECQLQTIKPSFVIDHHREGDPGYDSTYLDYWNGSSIGQLCSFLNIKKTHKLSVIAALDHCYSHAVRGLCPEVSDSDVRVLKYEEISKHHDITLETLYKIIHSFKMKLEKSNQIFLEDQMVYDLRYLDFSEIYSIGYLILQCALYEEGAVGLIQLPEDNSTKVILSGIISPETVRFFKNNWAPKNNLENIYGVPERGYAGGYVI